ncbi:MULTISPECIES: ABC transporter ATP-binding protein [Methanobacterium]|jgi:putative ABC transport system ATP-binding protein|uniref:ABC transporter ATP-binding protein n=2 Tax=Methanobacterium TaxID=2160 RepID=A0A9E5A4L0_9EURY|nr:MULTISPECIES: ABC transporter ATP-binding protein [Methanobacterium]MCZ3365275.1 ABC transporter ATP-binding protein [Methanobacterium veterum]MCZ3373026.1 ABC transporter ATP-binding protein [Methanobacterium veterum]OEC86312.1 ABC transporter ATP-binding protein [Methanobacterium sp. A39]PAV03215.1 ABC transporter ATP-binding protein [Methanobacterium bryantii]
MVNVVEIENLSKYYENGNVKALDGINLTIEEGEFVAIMGPSGSGKSTLLNMIGSLDRSDNGKIVVDGHDLLLEKDLSNFRSETIGFVFQLHNLLPMLSSLENIELPTYELKISSDEREKRASKLLKKVGLEDKAKFSPKKLSGGERQRIAVARALVNNPSIILADEPTGSLDSDNSQKILQLLKDLHKEENITLIIITHDPNIAQQAGRIVNILDGKIANG